MIKEKSGYIAIVGRPNVGKSTLLNGLIGKKISITSRKPQTTRHQILGIKTIDGVQAVYIDTPGLHKTEKNAMNRYMNRLAESVIADADVVVFMIDAMRWQSEDELALEKLKPDSAPVILVINKVDLVKDKNLLLPFIETSQEKFNFVKIVPLCARKASNIRYLEKVIMQLLPEGPHLFPDDQITDKSERFQAAEIIREKIILTTGQEIPYSTTVVIEEFKQEEKLLRISALIWVEREGQKPILIGKNGERLKLIGTAARKELEKLFDKKVFLQLWVKIKDNWTNNENFLSGLGLE
ncbi:MAG: GTPase Era [Gammaproteobacteria bacterium]|nr:GTPase Era [Gammaproteobacteria bacterium]